MGNGAIPTPPQPFLLPILKAISRHRFRLRRFRSLRVRPVCQIALLLVLLLATARALAADTDEDFAPAAYEPDRPGEIENPFTLPPGRVLSINYVYTANAQSRDNNDLGPGGSAMLFQTAARFGVTEGWEGEVLVDTYLDEVDKGPDGNLPGVSRAGLGFVTLRAKTNLTGNSGESGIGLVPFVHFPTNKTLTGQAGAEPGLAVPFNLEFAPNWGFGGSTELEYGFGDRGGREMEWDTETSIEWQLNPRLSVASGPETEVSGGRSEWDMEQGVTFDVTGTWIIDGGFNVGFGANAGALFWYLGMAFAF
jgi:hypothetical protein